MKIDGVNNKQIINDITSKKSDLKQDTKKELELNEVNIQNKEDKVSEDFIIKSIEKANEKLILADRKLEFSIHEKTKQIVVKVINTRSDEVVREFPSEKILDLVANMLERSGLLVDERA